VHKEWKISLNDIKLIDGKRTAILRSSPSAAEVDIICVADSLWVKPIAEDCLIGEPLSMPNIRQLYLAKCCQSLRQILTRDTLAKLHSLLISESDLALFEVEDVGCLPNLESLYIRRQYIEDDGFRWIGRQKNCLSLALTDTNATDDKLAMLECHAVLRRLDIFRTEVTFSGLSEFANQFPGVRSLDISETPVSSLTVATLRQLFPRLERLIAQRTDLTEFDLKQIASWPTLKVLDTGVPEIDFDYHNDPFWD
jgi:hypothetical protein